MNLLQGRSQTKTDLHVSRNSDKLIEVSQDGQGVKASEWVSDFGGGVNQVCLQYTSEVAGDYVLVCSRKVGKLEVPQVCVAPKGSYEIPR